MKKTNLRILSLLFCAALLILTFAGCSGKNNDKTDTPTETPASTDTLAATEAPITETEAPATIFEAGTKMELKYATSFSIEYLDNDMKLVTDGQGRQILILQAGQTAPAAYAELPSVTIPLTKAIYTSTTQVSYLRAFDDDTLFNSIVGVRATKDTWDFDSMIKRMENGSVVDIGSNTAMSTSYDYEIIQALTPNVVFTNTGMSTEQTDLMAMLDENDITYVFDASSKELDYRGTMEWVKFYAAFYNLENEAEAYFDEAMARIDEVIAITSKIPENEKVKVGWGIVTGGKIYVENGGAKSAQMVRDCGGSYIFDDIGADKDGVSELTAEEFYSRLSDADIFINRGMPKYGPDIDSIIEQFPTLADIKCLHEGTVLQITNNFWTSYHNIDGKYIEMSEFFYPDKFNTTTADKFTHFLIMPQTAE